MIENDTPRCRTFGTYWTCRAKLTMSAGGTKRTSRSGASRSQFDAKRTSQEVNSSHSQKLPKLVLAVSSAAFRFDRG